MQPYPWKTLKADMDMNDMIDYQNLENEFILKFKMLQKSSSE